MLINSMHNSDNTKTHKKSKKSTKADLPWVVIVYDDPVNLMEYVTQILQKVLSYDTAKAQRLMQQVHTKGKAIVWSGNKERAEFYVQQLHSYQLNATFESV